MNPPLITLTGEVGSGKTTVGKIIASQRGISYMSTGQMQREFARKQGLTTIQLNKKCLEDRSLDDALDNHLRDMGRRQEAGIIDARLGWHFVPNSYKVFLSVDPREGARRTFTAQRAEEENPEEITVMKNNLARRQIENQRFQQLYGIDCALLSNYDLVVDTTHVDSEQVAALVLSECAAHTEKKNSPHCFVCPKRLLPTQSARTIFSATNCNATSAAPQMEITAIPPVSVLAPEYFFILHDGHKRCCHALHLNWPWIPCEITPMDGTMRIKELTPTSFLRNNLNPEWIQEWELLHGFRFLSYPDAALRVVIPDSPSAR